MLCEKCQDREQGEPICSACRDAKAAAQRRYRARRKQVDRRAELLLQLVRIAEELAELQ